MFLISFYIYSQLFQLFLFLCLFCIIITYLLSLCSFFFCKEILKSKLQISNDKSNWVVTTQDPFETGLVGMKVAKKFNIPFHIQVHTDFLSPHFSKGFLNKIRLKIANKTLPLADGVRVVSNRIKDSIINSKLKNQNSKITVMPVFVDAEKIENSLAVFDLRAKYPQFNKIILIASRLEPEKDVHTALKAFSEVVRSNPKVGLVIVGDGSEKEILMSNVKSQKLDEHVVFEGWQDDLNSYYKGCDIFLNTSLYEGYGMTLIEASLNKKPMVTTDVGIAGGGGVLIHAQHALVAPVGDAGRIAGYLNSFLRDSNGARAMGLRAYTKVSGEVISQEKYYEEVVNDWVNTV